MKNLHAKSPCCQGEIYHFGNRRRQCSICKKTWRIRQKKRGRKRKREQKTLLIRYLQHEMPSLFSLARLKQTTERKLQARLSRSLNHFIKQTPWPKLPMGVNLIIIADAMVRYIQKEWHTFYFVLIREVKKKEAIIAPLCAQKGTETCLGWKKALDKIPDNLKTNIKAVVCDGHRGLVSYAKWHGWLVQRCHFHLIARVQGRRSKWKNSRHRDEGKIIYDLVNHVLTTADENSAISHISKIEEIGWHTKSPDLKKTLSGFVDHYQDYRTYLHYQKLHLPKTNNAAESLIGCVQSLCHRARGFCTISSLTKWICALLKNKKKIKCNGYYQPN